MPSESSSTCRTDNHQQTALNTYSMCLEGIQPTAVHAAAGADEGRVRAAAGQAEAANRDRRSVAVAPSAQRPRLSHARRRAPALLTMWYSLPASSTRRCGVDHIHRPLVHGRVVEPIWKPPVICSSWLRMKLLPWG